MREWSEYQKNIFSDVSSGSGHTVVVARAGSGKTTVIMESLARVPGNQKIVVVAFNKEIRDELQRRVGAAGITNASVYTLHGYGLSAITASLGRPVIDADKARKAIESMVGDSKESWDYRRALQRAVSLSKACLAETTQDVLALVDAHEIDIDDPQIEEIESFGRSARWMPPGACAARIHQLAKRYKIQVEKLDDDAANDAALQIVGQIRAALELQFAGLVLAVMKAARETTSVVDFDDMIYLPVVLGLDGPKAARVFVDETQDLNKSQIAMALSICAVDGRICAVGDDRQAIYGFRGADRNAVQNVIAGLSAKVLPLSVTYRCASSIVEEAQKFVPDLEAAPNAKPGIVRKIQTSSMEEEVKPGDFVLSRKRAPLIGQCLRLLAAGIPATVRGQDIGAGLKSLIKKSKARTTRDLLAWLETWKSAEIDKARAKSPDAEIDHITDRAACIETLADGCATTHAICQKIDNLFSETLARGVVICSTVHKAKGLEAERVFLLEDTFAPWRGTEEQNLLYVAITRARSELVYVRERTEVASG